MKKLLVTLSIISIAFIFGSCKKEYTCECTTTMTGFGTTTSSTTIKDTKNNAKDACEGGSSTTTVNGVSASVTCKLK